ncbi:TPA: LexA family protein [Legionella pneumophila]
MFAVQEEPIPCPIPYYGCKVQAGFPSPADDYLESYLDLNQHLVDHPAATFFVRAAGDSMKGAGIASGDLLVVDRSITPTHGRIVIAALNGELTVKRLYLSAHGAELRAENPRYAPIPLTEDLDAVIWGVVTHHVRSHP